MSTGDFFEAISTDLKPTNMYVFLKPKQALHDPFGDQFERHDEFRLPAMCRTTMLNIRNDSNAAATNCCQDLLVFDDDLKPMNQSNNETNKTDLICESTEDSRLPNNHENVPKNGEMDFASEKSLRNSFFECKISVKGFKDQRIKGKSIWVHKI